MTSDDRGSANGTHLTESHRPAAPVVPGLPMTISSGTLVDLGGGLSFVVEDVA